MNYMGDYAHGQIVYIYFNTFDSNDPSASVTMTNFINTDVHIHRDDNLTQRNNAAGITVDVDVDAIAGSHFIKIDTSDDTVGDFYQAGHDYFVRIEGVTIDAATVNAVVGCFSLENRRVAGEMARSQIATLASQTSFTLTSGEASADDDAYNGCMCMVTDETTMVQKCVGLISNYTGSSRTVTLAEDPGVFTMAVGDKVTVFATAAKAVVRAVGPADSYVLQTANDNAADINDILVDTGTTLPAQIGGLGAASGGSVNIEATSDNTGGGSLIGAGSDFVGSVQSGTYASTEAEDGVLHDIDDVGNNIDVTYGFAIGGARIATEVSFAGFVQGAGDDMDIEVYDHVGSDWEVLGTIEGAAVTTNVALDLPLLSKHTGTGAELGNVYIRFDLNTGTPSNLSVDKLLVSAVNAGTSIGYVEGAVWFDDSASNTNTESYVDGTADNPVSTLGAARTIADALNIKSIRCLPGTTATLTAASWDNFHFIGHNYTVALAGRSIDGSTFENALITGIGEATTTQPYFDHCSIGAATIPPAHLDQCGIGNASGTFTAPAGSGQYVFHECYSEVPGDGQPTFDFSPVTGATGINNRGWFGGAIYTLDTNCTLSHEVIGGGLTTVTPADAAVEIRGLCRAITIALADTDVGNTIQVIANTGPVTITSAGSGDSATINLYGTCASVTDGSSGGSTVTNNMVSNTSIGDVVWDEAKSGHTAGGSFGEEVQAHYLSAEMTAEDRTLPAQGAPSVTPSLQDAILWLFKAFRNKTTQTATEWDLYNDAGDTVDTKATVSDDGTTATKGELASGP